MEKNLVVQGKIRDYTIYLVMSWIIHQTGIRIPIFNHQYFMASISPRSTESKVGFHPSFTLGSLLQRRGGSKWDMKIHQNTTTSVMKHHQGCFRLKSSNNFAMVGCQTAKVPREAVEAEVVESARDTPAG